MNLSTTWGPPIIIVAWNCQIEVLKALLANGANPNGTHKKQTALHKAAQNGRLECVTLLIRAGANVNALNALGEPPIHLAKKEGHETVAQYLLNHGYKFPRPPPS